MKNFELSERTVNKMLMRSVEMFPDKRFAVSGDWNISYGKLNEKVNSCANSLNKLGVTKGTKVALFLRNSPAFIYSWFAISKLGGVYVPINTEYKGDILQYQLNKADVSHIILDSDFVERFSGIEKKLSKLICMIEHDRPDYKAGTFPLALNIKRLSFDELLIGSISNVITEVSYTDPHAISFTSGTTGPSKGVLATNCHVVTFALDWIEACKYNSEDILFTPLPMFHAIATWLGILPTVIIGNEASFSEKFSASKFWDEVRHYNASVIHGIFSMIPILLKQPISPNDKNVPARLFYIGQRNSEFEKRFNCKIVEVYGATETGIVTYTPFNENANKGSCGKENDKTYFVSILDKNDQKVKIGEVGEIVVRPKQPYSMMSEYYKMPNESLSAYRNLWFHTGDNGKIDEDGFFYFVDRKNDAIRRRGENISSFELERVINSDEKVLECAAVAVPSELGEDDIKIVIVPQIGFNLTPKEVWDRCEKDMPKFWVPRYLEFRESLPKTPNQKIQKYLLRLGDPNIEIYDKENFYK
ncbi:AMP-binding protein [Alphaproteobacteria bacterium]|nr:AMP-binding protein [Alphaproteobacteria bacterium]